MKEYESLPPYLHRFICALMRLLHFIAKGIDRLFDIGFFVVIIYILCLIPQNSEVICNLNSGYVLYKDYNSPGSSYLRYHNRAVSSYILPVFVHENNYEMHVEQIDYNKRYILARTDDGRSWFVDKAAPFKNPDEVGRAAVTGPLDSSTYYHLKDSLLVRGKHWERQSK